MRIVHIGKFYPPEWGGIESVTEALAEDHAASGHEVTVVCFTRKTSATEEGNPKIVRVRAPLQRASQPLSINYLREGIRAGRQADILHVHTPNPLAAFVCRVMPRTTRVVLHWHADIYGKGLLGYLVRPLERTMLARADAVVCTTRAYASSSPALRPIINKVTSIPIGIDECSFPSGDNGLGDYVLFVGRLVPYKGLSVLLEAMSKLPIRISMIIVGEGPLRGELEVQADTLGIRDRVHFFGPVDQATLNTLFAHARLLCLPSVNRLEAFGVTLLEAMRAEKPVITANIPGSGVPWVNQNGVTGTVVPVADPDALAAAIEQLLVSPELYRALAQGARERYCSEFTRKLMAERFLDLYKRLLLVD